MQQHTTFDIHNTVIVLNHAVVSSFHSAFFVFVNCYCRVRFTSDKQEQDHGSSNNHTVTIDDERFDYFYWFITNTCIRQDAPNE